MTYTNDDLLYLQKEVNNTTVLPIYFRGLIEKLILFYMKYNTVRSKQLLATTLCIGELDLNKALSLGGMLHDYTKYNKLDFI